MDTITHGIAGALLGKALFGGDDLLVPKAAERGPRMTASRIVTAAATLGAVFPDSDIVRDVLSRNDLLILTWHRSVTHSFLCLPAFAFGFAWVTQWLARKFKWECPSFAQLALVYAVGLGSHIFLDLLNSFGTMVWSPLEWTRPAWDLIFIIDFTLTALLLLPQSLARLYEQGEKLAQRALRLWLLYSVAAIVVAGLLQIAGYPLSVASVIGVIAALAAFIFLPILRDWGSRLSRAEWCRAGLAAAVLYIAAAGIAHHAALNRVKQFALLERLEVESLAAMPLPPSLWHWDGLIRTSRGVYELRMDLAQRATAGPSPEGAIEYGYYPDALDNPFIEEARQLPQVKTVLWFARFPVMRFRRDADASIVEIVDLRFLTARSGQRPAFTYRVRFDGSGRVLSLGWARR